MKMNRKKSVIQSNNKKTENDDNEKAGLIILEILETLISLSDVIIKRIRQRRAQ